MTILINISIFMHISSFSFVLRKENCIIVNNGRYKGHVHYSVHFHSNFRSNTASFIHYSFNLVCKASYLECWLSLFYIPHGKLKRVPVQRPSNYCDISVPRWNIDQILIENLTNACRRMLWRHRCEYRQITL